MRIADGKATGRISSCVQLQADLPILCDTSFHILQVFLPEPFLFLAAHLDAGCLKDLIRQFLNESPVIRIAGNQ